MDRILKREIMLGNYNNPNNRGLKDDDTYTCELRSEYESAKHKILDIIGDLHDRG